MQQNTINGKRENQSWLVFLLRAYPISADMLTLLASSCYQSAYFARFHPPREVRSRFSG